MWAHISLRGDSLIYQTGPKNRQSRSGSSGALIEGNCPKCGDPFEIWYAANLRATHLIDLELDRPDVFSGAARETVDQLAAERAAQEARTAQARLLRVERHAAEELARQEVARREEAERQQKVEARQAQLATDDGDGSDDDGGRSPRDDRSDSMNPNNDAYQSSMDNRSDQMNPNNDSYGSSRGR